MIEKIKAGILVLLLASLIIGCNDRNSASNQEIEEVKEETKVQEETFEIHYIDVGQADATLVMCDGKNMLIDGGNVEDSSLMYSYLEDHGIDYIDYMICTHAHEDHIGGLAGALNYAQVDIVYCPTDNDETEEFKDFDKYVEKQGEIIQIPEAGSEFFLGSAKCNILGINTFDDDPNNTSIVLKIEYGETAFLFSGDAEASVENVIIEEGNDISCTVMKAPHHGSDTSLSYRWLNEAMPEYAVISAGEGNSYGHPCEETLSKLRDAQVKVFRTDMQGDIICTSDGYNVVFEVEKNPFVNTLENIVQEPVVKNEEEIQKSPVSGDYILNTNTQKFHYPSCHSVDDMKEKNKQSSSLSRDEIIEQGYSPCRNCHP